MGLIADDVVVDNVIYKILSALMPAIDSIDGSCSVCIRNFVSDANEELYLLKIPYRYEYTKPKYELKVVEV